MTLYIAEITYVPTWAGFSFLAAVLDACTRQVVGWYSPHRRHSSINYLSPVNYEQRLKSAASIPNT